jgi:hypothetical protein
VAQTQDGKNLDFVSLKDFGSTGAGLGDSTAIQTAATNAQQTNAYGTFKRAINLRSGYYLHTGTTITLPSGTTLAGEGPGSTRIDGGGYGAATGVPMFTIASAPDWRLSGLRLEGGNKGSCVYFGPSSYYGVAEQSQFNGFKTYGVWLNEAAQSVFRSCAWNSASATTDVAVVTDGGSQTMLMSCQFDSNSIGVQSSTSAAGTYHSASAAGSGLLSIGSTFGRQFPALKIGNGNSLHVIFGDYIEGSGGVNSDLFDIGSFDSGGGSAQTNVAWLAGITAGSKVNDITINNAGTFSMAFRECNVNVTVGASTKWLYAVGNTFAAGKTLTSNAQWSTVDARNLRIMAASAANAQRQDSIDATFQVFSSALNFAGSNYVLKTVHAQSFDWALSGSATTKMTLTAGGYLQTPAGIRPGALGASPAQQTATAQWGGTGAPSNSFGANGDFYFRSDGGAGTSIYMKRAGAWVGIV